MIFLKIKLNSNLIKGYKQIVSLGIMCVSYQALVFTIILLSSVSIMPITFALDEKIKNVEFQDPRSNLSIS